MYINHPTKYFQAYVSVVYNLPHVGLPTPGQGPLFNMVLILELKNLLSGQHFCLSKWWQAAPTQTSLSCIQLLEGMWNLASSAHHK